MSIGVVCLFAGWAVGQFARDATWLTGLCFYLPSAVVAAVSLVAAVLNATARRRIPSLFATVLALPPLLMVTLVENRLIDSLDCGSSDLRLVHWNTGGRPARPGVGDYLIAERADLYVLTDVPNASHVGVLHDRLGKEYHASTFSNLAVVGRGEVRADGWLVNRDGFEVQEVTWAPPGQPPLRLLVVDLPSDVWVARDPLLREVNALIGQYGPDLVVGDFNAPRRSWALANLPHGYKHAYYTCGGGWGYTWPVPVPMYAIDHCLHGRRVRPGSYRLGGLGGDSDHRYQVFDFSVADNSCELGAALAPLP
jgi:hypothetical protein